MSLTEKTRKHLASLSVHQDAISEFVFEEFGEGELTEFTDKLAALNRRMEKARLKIALDF
jgi:DNA-binding MarR family transcriptional regulator